jgi:hypothetical protein
MIQGGRSFGFALEAAQGLWAFGYVVWQELRATKRFSLMSSALYTELLDDAIMRNVLADHWAQILGLGMGQPPVSRKLTHSDVVAAGYRHRGNFGGLRRLPFGKGFRRTTSYLADSFHFIHKSAKYRLIFV